MAEPKFPDLWATPKLPQWRCELMDTLKELADPVYQQKAWIEQSLDKDKIVGAQQVYHSLFDDLRLGEDPQGAIGKFLFDADELAAVEAVTALLAAVRSDLGQVTSAACVAHPLWAKAVAAAALARARLAEKGEAKTP